VLPIRSAEPRHLLVAAGARGVVFPMSAFWGGVGPSDALAVFAATLPVGSVGLQLLWVTAGASRVVLPVCIRGLRPFWSVIDFLDTVTVLRTELPVLALAALAGLL